jgi:hypothetical protein
MLWHIYHLEPRLYQKSQPLLKYPMYQKYQKSQMSLKNLKNQTFLLYPMSLK